METTTPATEPAAVVLVALGAVADAYEALQGLADQPLDGATAAALIRLDRWARPHYRAYAEARSQHAAAFGEKLSGGQFRVPPEHIGAYEQALRPVRSEKIELDPALRVGVGALAHVRISPASLSALGPFLEGL